VIADGQLYFTSFQEDERTLHCLDAATGTTKWQRSVKKVHDENATRPAGPATCTPAANQGNVVAFFPDAGLCCFSADGQPRWQVALGPFYSMHGISGSPIIAGDKVVLQIDQLRGSFIAAYELTTGEQAWRVDRLDGLTGGYSTPSIISGTDGHLLVIASGPHELSAYRVADGEAAWSVRGVTNAPVSVPTLWKDRVFTCEPVGKADPITMLSPLDGNKDGKYELEEVKRNVAIFRLLSKIDKRFGNDDGIVVEEEWNKSFGAFVDKGGLVSVDLSSTHDLSKPQVKWTYRKTVPYVPSILILDDILYFAQGGGIVTALDPGTGEMIKRDRLKKGGGSVYSSPVGGDGKVYLVDTAGTMTVIRGGREWEAICSESFDEPCFATPAICNNRLYVRTASKLYCFGQAD
jgi:outer membrane protein assembly factor BamB